MKFKNRRKTLLILGTILTVSTPVVAVISCGTTADNTKGGKGGNKSIDAKATNTALKYLDLKFNGINGSGTFNVPKWDTIANTTLEYGKNNSDTTAPTIGWQNTPIKGLTNITDYIWVKAKAKKGYTFSGPIVPHKYQVNGLTAIKTIDTGPVNTALQSVHLTFSGISTEATFTVSDWSINNTTLEFAIGNDGITPPTSGWNNTPLTGLSNHNWIWIKAVAANGYIFTGADIAPNKIQIKNLSKPIKGADVNVALANLPALTFSSTNGTGTFDRPTWTNSLVAGSSLTFAVAQNESSPAPNISAYDTTIPRLLQNGNVIFILAQANPGYGFVGDPLTPHHQKVLGLAPVPILLKTVNDALNAINLAALNPTGTNGTGTISAPRWNVHGTTLMYAKTDTDTAPGDITDYNATIPANWSNTNYLWITAIAVSPDTIDGTPTPIKIEVTGFARAQIPVNTVNDALNAITLTDLHSAGISGAGTISAPTWNVHGTTLLYAKKDTNLPPSTIGDYNATFPSTGWSNTNYLWITAIAVSPDTIDTTPTPIKIQVTNLQIDVTHVDDQLQQTPLSVGNTNKAAGTGTLVASPWDTVANPLIANTELLYSITKNGTAPAAGTYKRFESLSAQTKSLVIHDRIWIKAVAINSLTLSAPSHINENQFLL